MWEIAPRDSKGFLEAEHPRRRNQHTKSESVRLGALGESDATPASQGARTGRVVSELGAVSVPPRLDSTIARVKIQYVVQSISSMDAAQYLRRTPAQKAERASQLGGDPTLRVPGRGTGTGGGSNASGGEKPKELDGGTCSAGRGQNERGRDPASGPGDVSDVCGGRVNTEGEEERADSLEVCSGAGLCYQLYYYRLYPRERRGTSPRGEMVDPGVCGYVGTSFAPSVLANPEKQEMMARGGPRGLGPVGNNSRWESDDEEAFEVGSSVATKAFGRSSRSGTLICVATCVTRFGASANMRAQSDRPA